MVKPVKNKVGYEVNVNIIDLLDKFKNVSGKNNIIDLHVKYQSEYEKLPITNELINYIRGKQIISLTPLLNLKYYVINNETLGIQLLAKNVKAVVKDLEISKDFLQFQISTFINNEQFPLMGNQLFISKRSISNTPDTYIEKHKISVDNTATFILNAEVLTKFCLDEKEIFDLLIEYQDQNFSLQVPLNAGTSNITVKKWREIGPYDLFLLKGKTENLSIRMNQRKTSLELEEIKMTEDAFTLKIKNARELFNNNHSLKFQLRSALEGMNNKDTIVFYEQTVNHTQNNNDIDISVNLRELFGEFSSNFKRQFKLFIVSGSQLYKLNYVDFSYSLVCNQTKISIFFDDSIVVETSLLDTNPIPIAIMGSCFSRMAFNSQSEYFNPQYKKYFKVSYSYFWPSIIGSVSEPLPYDKNLFHDVPEGNLFEIEWEFLKNWEKALHDSGAEYLLLDFFVDAMHGVLQLGPNQFLARNLYTRKTNYYQSTLLKKGKSVDSYHPEFFDLWTKSFDLFIEKVKKIIPEEKLILNLSLLTDKYHDENGSISSFFNTKMITKSHFAHVNNTWTKMNNYFLTKLPKAKVIDMNSFGYISQFDAPMDLAPCGPHHFESDYYKSIVNELIKVITLGDRLPKSENQATY